MQIWSTATPAALAREAQRCLAMARHAEDRPAGYTREAWERRCRELARRYASQAARD